MLEEGKKLDEDVEKAKDQFSEELSKQMDRREELRMKL